MRRTNNGDDAAEFVFTQPDDFFLPTNPTMVCAKPTWAFANSQLVLNNPGEVSWGDSKGPLAPKFWWH
jgi:hypothetical protein